MQSLLSILQCRTMTKSISLFSFVLHYRSSRSLTLRDETRQRRYSFSYMDTIEIWCSIMSSGGLSCWRRCSRCIWFAAYPMLLWPFHCFYWITVKHHQTPLYWETSVGSWRMTPQILSSPHQFMLYRTKTRLRESTKAVGHLSYNRKACVLGLYSFLRYTLSWFPSITSKSISGKPITDLYSYEGFKNRFFFCLPLLWVCKVCYGVHNKLNSISRYT